MYLNLRLSYGLAFTEYIQNPSIQLMRVCSQRVQLLHSIKHADRVFNGPGDLIIADISEKQKGQVLRFKHTPAIPNNKLRIL